MVGLGPDDAVLYELHDHVVTITYNRPAKRNAVNGAMREGLNAAFIAFRDDPDAWIAIITGAGKAFCAGADLSDGAGSTGTFAGTYWEIPTINSFESGLELFKPTIAAVNGACVGYGLTLASRCDFVLASTDATFSYPEAQLGIGAMVGAIRLPSRVGWSDAMELLMTGEPIDAPRAREIGLVWRLHEPASLLEEARAFADRLKLGAPLATRAMKEVALRSEHMPWTESVRFAETMRRVLGTTDDAAEGRAARRENRPPRWSGS